MAKVKRAERSVRKLKVHAASLGSAADAAEVFAKQTHDSRRARLRAKRRIAKYKRKERQKEKEQKDRLHWTQADITYLESLDESRLAKSLPARPRRKRFSSRGKSKAETAHPKDVSAHHAEEVTGDVPFTPDKSAHVSSSKDGTDTNAKQAPNLSSPAKIMSPMTSEGARWLDAGMSPSVVRPVAYRPYSGKIRKKDRKSKHPLPVPTPGMRIPWTQELLEERDTVVAGSKDVSLKESARETETRTDDAGRNNESGSIEDGVAEISSASSSTSAPQSMTPLERKIAWAEQKRKERQVQRDEGDRAIAATGGRDGRQRRRRRKRRAKSSSVDAGSSGDRDENPFYGQR